MQPKKVLVVNDSRAIHRMFEIMLRQYPLVYASDGRQALERLDDHQDIDLVLLDTNMPNMNGAEFMEQIRERQNRPRVIVVTAQGSGDEPIEGTDDTIALPFHAEEILSKIDSLPQ